MAQAILLWLTRAQVILAVLALVLLTAPSSALRWGDRFQVALPLLAWACAGNRGEGAEFALRYAVMFTLAHGTKRSLGEIPANTRPDGGRHGFPSAHTSTAVLGASRLAHDCLRGAPLAQAAVIGAAAFTGASRIEGQRHDIWQVMAGALLGYACDRALRRPSPLRARVAAALALARRHAGAALRLLVRGALAARTPRTG